MANWEDDFDALQFAIVEDKNDYAVIKMESRELSDLTKLEFNVSFVDSTRELRVRIRNGGELHGFNYEVKGLINTSNLAGGLKKEKRRALLRIEKNEKFRF